MNLTKEIQGKLLLFMGGLYFEDHEFFRKKNGGRDYNMGDYIPRNNVNEISYNFIIKYILNNIIIVYYLNIKIKKM